MNDKIMAERLREEIKSEIRMILINEAILVKDFNADIREIDELITTYGRTMRAEIGSLTKQEVHKYMFIEMLRNTLKQQELEMEKE